MGADVEADGSLHWPSADPPERWDGQRIMEWFFDRRLHHRNQGCDGFEFCRDNTLDERQPSRSAPMAASSLRRSRHRWCPPQAACLGGGSRTVLVMEEMPPDPFATTGDGDEFWSAASEPLTVAEAVARFDDEGAESGLTDAEMAAAITQAIAGADGAVMSTEMVTRMVNELVEVKASASLFHLWRNGDLHVGLDADGQLAFRRAH